MYAVVQFSTGVGSAEVAYRAVEKYGLENTILLTADTRVEDEDNWRFAIEVVIDLGMPEWIVLCDGRTPMEVGRDARCVPNNRMAVCSRVLKRDLLRSYIESRWQSDEAVFLLGFDWTEPRRFDASVEAWRPYHIEAPLMDPPLMQKAELIDRMRARGIEAPRLYAAGFPHANCGGACVRAGQVEWRRLLFWDRDRYLQWEADEQVTREMLQKDVAILRHRSGEMSGRPLTLKSFREKLEDDARLFDKDDYGACACFGLEIDD